MSVADEDTELRDLLVQTLDKNGVLGKIKAELRASIFLTLEAQDQVKNPSALSNAKLQNFLSKPEGSLCVDVLHEFFEYFNLDYTSAVFCPETNTSYTSKSRSHLCQKLNISESDVSPHVPVLASIIHEKTSSHSSSKSPSETNLRRAQNLFSTNCDTSSDTISHSSTLQIFASLCPKFPLFLLERFIAEEASSVSQDISFKTFCSMYTKLYEACHSVITDDGVTGIVVDDSSKLSRPGSAEDAGRKPPIGFSERNADASAVRSNSSSSPDGASVPTGIYDNFFDDDYYSKPQDSPKKFTDSRPSNSMKLPPLSEPTNVVSNASDLSSKGDWPAREKSTSLEYDKRQGSYVDDFNTTSHASISEEIQGDSLLSSSHSSMGELTEDRSISEKDSIRAEYLEDVKKY